jgi:drug/metabolite transporter (DMT)-like permease
MDTSLILAFSACLSFSVSSLGFRKFSRDVSSLWMNFLKVSVALLCFAGVNLYTGRLLMPVQPGVLGWLALSGFLGLTVGDYFLLKAYALIGTARTLIFFSFSPLFLGVGSYFLFKQSLAPIQLAAVFFLVACLLVLGLESRNEHGSWNLRGLGLALLGVTLDACGVLMTRFAFESQVELDPFQANLYRCLGSFAGFVLLEPFFKVRLLSRWRALKGGDRALSLGVSLSGTFLSLSLWLAAIQRGKLALISSVSGAGPVFATLFECAVERKWPSRYLIGALLLFLVGFALLQAPALQTAYGAR